MEIKVRGYKKSFKAGYNECNELWKEKIRQILNAFVLDQSYLKKVLEELLNE